MQQSDELLATYPIISDQVSTADIHFVLDSLQKVVAANTPGAVVEFGCYIGTTSLFIRRMLDRLGASTSYPFHVYDSFEGLPAKAKQDESIVGINFHSGALSVSKKQFVHEFYRAGLKPPAIHKGWFDQLATDDVPDQIAFAFLDGDFYNSIYAALQLVWPRMSGGGVVLIHDYSREALPGVTKAVQDFFRSKAAMPPLQLSRSIAALHA